MSRCGSMDYTSLPWSEHFTAHPRSLRKFAPRVDQSRLLLHTKKGAWALLLGIPDFFRRRNMEQLRLKLCSHQTHWQRGILSAKVSDLKQVSSAKPEASEMFRKFALGTMRTPDSKKDMKMVKNFFSTVSSTSTSLNAAARAATRRTASWRLMP